MRGGTPGRSWKLQQCKRGHPLTDDNVIVVKQGRLCRTCREASIARHEEKLKRGVANKDKTHCKNGHEFTPENTYLRERYKGGPMLRVCRECNLLSARRARLKHYYGITPEQYDAMLEAQGGGCAICGAGPGPSGRLLHVDHCHKTKRVRGVLCSRCNTYLGHMNDDPALIRRAADYLEGVCLSTR